MELILECTNRKKMVLSKKEDNVKREMVGDGGVDYIMNLRRQLCIRRQWNGKRYRNIRRPWSWW